MEAGTDRALTAVAATALLGALSVWLQGLRLDALMREVSDPTHGAASASAKAGAMLKEAVVAGVVGTIEEAEREESQGALPRSTTLWCQWLTQVGRMVIGKVLCSFLAKRYELLET